MPEEFFALSENKRAFPSFQFIQEKHNNQGKNIDWVNIMAYDAGPTYDPIGALECYRIYYQGPLLLGFEIGDMAWGGYKITLRDVVNWCSRTLKENRDNGVFIWAYHKDPAGTPTVQDIITVATALV